VPNPDLTADSKQSFPPIVLGKKEIKKGKREETSQNGKKVGLANAKYIL
jgi:hypothetical protein